MRSTALALVALATAALLAGCGNAPPRKTETRPASGTLTEQQARQLASELALQRARQKGLIEATGQPARSLAFATAAWTVRQVKGRWVLTYEPPTGVQAAVSFDLDGSDPNVYVHYARQ